MAYHYLLWNTGYKVSSINSHILRRIINILHGGTNLDFYLFCSTLANEQAMIPANSLHNISSKFIPCYSNGLITNNTCQGDYRYTGCAASNVDNHITYRLFHIRIIRRANADDGRTVDGHGHEFLPRCELGHKDERFDARPGA